LFPVPILVQWEPVKVEQKRPSAAATSSSAEYKGALETKTKQPPAAAAATAADLLGAAAAAASGDGKKTGAGADAGGQPAADDKKRESKSSAEAWEVWEAQLLERRRSTALDLMNAGVLSDCTLQQVCWPTLAEFPCNSQPIVLLLLQIIDALELNGDNVEQTVAWAIENPIQFFQLGSQSLGSISC
jgi:hypothetical protein